MSTLPPTPCAFLIVAPFVVITVVIKHPLLFLIGDSRHEPFRSLREENVWKLVPLCRRFISLLVLYNDGSV